MLNFSQIKYEKGGKTILRTVSGNVRKGEVLAIMGPSGCGKTTLLNILSQRISGYRGEVTLNDQPCTKSLVKKYASYVMQSDADIKTYMTVRQNILYNAALTLPTLRQAKQRTSELIESLSLSKCAENYAGRISGGQKRRCSIACQIAHSPSLLFMDEPTSGLDAHAANKLTNLLLSLAEKEKVIIVTSIHQPSAECFLSFNKLLLLNKDGLPIFYGHPRESLSLLDVEEKSFINPADRLLDLCQRDDVEAYVTEEEDELYSFLPEEDDVLPLPWRRQSFLNVKPFSVLLWRMYLELKFNWIINLYSLVGKNVLLALLTLLIFYNLDNSQQSITDRFGLMYYVLSNKAFGGAWHGLPILAQRNTLNRERINGLYSSSSYYFSRVLMQIPFFVLECIISTIIVYPAVLGRSIEGALFFFLVSFLCELCSHGSGYLVATCSPDNTAAVSLMTMFTVIMVTLGGWIRRNSRMPIFMEYFSYVSYMRYGFHALAVSNFDGLVLSCDDVQGNSTCLSTGEEALDYNGIDQTLGYFNVLVMLGMLLLYHLIALAAFTFFYRKQGRKS